MGLQHPDVVTYLRDLIAIDTSNPPGRELPAARYVAQVLASEGISAQILESAPERASVVARVRGDGSARPLLLLSHLDVVPARAEAWRHPPFEAVVADDHVWGRGALDCKLMTATHLAIMLGIQRDGRPLKRDIILAATADEETGGELGVGWIQAHHPDLLDCEYAINEGGGYGLTMGSREICLVDTGEKGSAWLKLTARGTPGHASVPHGDNAVAKLSETLVRLDRARLPLHRTRSMERMLPALGALLGFPARQILPLLLKPALEPLLMPLLARYTTITPALAAMLHNTITPTMVQAGTKVNVIPSEAAARVDGRLLPGQSVQDLLREIGPYVGSEVEIEVVSQTRAWESEPDSPLYQTIIEVLAEQCPDCTPLPFLMPGSSDAHYLASQGSRVYGFHPLRPEPDQNIQAMMHAPNERVSLANIEYGARVLDTVVRRFASR